MAQTDGMEGGARTPDEVTALLRDAREGGEGAMDRLWGAILGEVRQMAGAVMAGESRKGILQPTMLVSEAFLRVDPREQDFENRAHFFSAIRISLRRIVVDHARSEDAEKRGGGRKRVSLEIAEGEMSRFEPELFQEAGRALGLLDELAAVDEKSARAAKVVEFRFLMGMSVEQVAAVLGVSERTVKSDWQYARAWLLAQLEGGDEMESG